MFQHTCAAALALAFAWPIAVGAQEKARTPPGRASAERPAAATSTRDDAKVQALVARLLAATDAKDVTAALTELRRLADQGSAAAQLTYGRAAMQGQFMAVDVALAERYLRRAAVAGNADAKYSLAMLLLTSPDKAGSRKEAIDLLQQSAKTVPESVYMLALVKARESPEPAAAERKVVAAAAEAGFAPAQYQLGVDMLREGPDKARDLVAAEWLGRASDQGIVPASFDLGILYLEGVRVPRDVGKAFRMLNRAADAGSASAEYAIGRAYTLGEGVTADHRQAILYTSRAAAKGLPEAEYAMGFAYSHGVGVPVDDALALEWFKRAAAKGHPDAYFAMGNAYANGYGVGKDMKTAYDWYCKGARTGHAEALAMVKRQPPENCRFPAVTKP